MTVGRSTRSAILVAVAVLAGTGAGARRAPAQSTNPAEWVRDVREVLAAIDSIHPAPYRVHSRGEWEAAALELERRLPSLRYHEAVAELGRLVALAGDGHTRLGQVRLEDHQRVELDLLPGEGFETEYPLILEAFSDGLYVTHAMTTLTELFGKRVVAINGRTIAAAVDALRPYIAHDNEAWFAYLVPRYLTSPAYLHAAGLAPRIDAWLELTLEDADGARSRVAIEPLPVETERKWIEAADHLAPASAPEPLYRRMTRNYEFTYLEQERTVYVRYRQVQNVKDEPIHAFAQRLFQFVDSADVERLIIDVRRNGGGNNYLNQPIVHELIKSEKVNRPGRLFVVIDRGTFSAAISFVGDVERHTQALFVGEPTGSPLNQYGDSRKVTLPASGLVVRISTLYWQQADPRDPRPWLAPDIPAPISFTDYVEHRDPALEAIFAYEYEPGTLQPFPNRNWWPRSQREDTVAFVRW